MTLTPTTIPSALDHALAYAALEWRVVPIRPGGKSPSIERWPEQATTDAELIRQWWSRWPDHGVGIATAMAWGLLVLDVDPAHGGDETLADLESAHGALPATVEALTGGGGRHVLFAWPPLPEGVHLGNSAGRLGPGLDVRAEGGQIVAAPTLHPETGRAYEWEASSLPGSTPLAPAPEWLLELLTESATALPDGQVEGGGADERYAWDRFNAGPEASARAVQLLSAAGWHSPRRDRHGAIYLTRPGKGAGNSCSVGHVAPGVTVVFTDQAPPLEPRGYRPAELLAALRYGGDRVAADVEVMALVGGAPTYALAAETAAYVAGERARAAVLGAEAQGEGDGPSGPQPIDWPSFWTREHVGEDWLVHPILPRGRQVALWARHKTGKSLLTLEIAAALATGRGCLSQEAAEPIDVIYLDMEMTEDDLHERLSDLDYGPEMDLSRLHYYLLPSLPPLDTDKGGAVVHELARRHGAMAVVIDTMARVVAGDENDADTYRDFYRCTGMGLKAMGVSVLRLDHGGKDPTKGQRGSSSKGDDVDVVWQLKPLESGLELKRDVARMSWVPEQVSLVRTEAPLRHLVTSGGMWPAGTAEAADELTKAGVDAGMSQTKAFKIYREAGYKRDTTVLRAALKYLKQRESEATVRVISASGEGLLAVSEIEGARPPVEGATPWGEEPS